MLLLWKFNTQMEIRHLHALGCQNSWMWRSAWWRTWFGFDWKMSMLFERWKAEKKRIFPKMKEIFPDLNSKFIFLTLLNTCDKIAKQKLGNQLVVQTINFFSSSKFFWFILHLLVVPYLVFNLKTSVKVFPGFVTSANKFLVGVVVVALVKRVDNVTTVGVEMEGEGRVHAQ